MFRLYLALIPLLFSTRTQVLSVRQADKVLDVSVLIRMKQYTVDNLQKVHRTMGGCSGTFVSNNRILTAAHCFDNPTTDIWVRGQDGVSYGATLVKLNAERDLALLEVKKLKKHKHAKVNTSVRVGEQVINVGSPLSFEFLVSEGIVASSHVWLKKFKAYFLLTTAMINPGSSGGGAFNSDGELIGVNTMSVGMFGWAGISIAVDADGVKEFLDGSI